MTAPPVRVEQVIDGSTFSVQVTLDPALVITALAHALRGNTEKLMLIRALPSEHSSHRHALAELRTLLADVFTVVLSPAETNALASDMYEAGIEPARCVHDEVFAVVTVDGDPLCAGHARAFDQAQVTG